jgi:hypothetical protein
MKQFWIIIAATCVVVAAVLLWSSRFNAAFVVVALGVVAWFLSYRVQLRAITAEADARSKDQNNEED